MYLIFSHGSGQEGRWKGGGEVEEGKKSMNGRAAKESEDDGERNVENVKKGRKVLD